MKEGPGSSWSASRGAPRTGGSTCASWWGVGGLLWCGGGQQPVSSGGVQQPVLRREGCRQGAYGLCCAGPHEDGERTELFQRGSVFSLACSGGKLDWEWTGSVWQRCAVPSHPVGQQSCSGVGEWAAACLVGGGPATCRAEGGVRAGSRWAAPRGAPRTRGAARFSRAGGGSVACRAVGWEWTRSVRSGRAATAPHKQGANKASWGGGD